MPLSDAQLFGRGIAFPPRVGADGRWSWSAGTENVRQSIRLILLTEARERIMLPEFGGGLKQHLFQPNTSSTHRLIENAITQSLGRWERRIRLESVTVVPDPENPQAALATIAYKLVATQEQDALQLQVVLS